MTTNSPTIPPQPKPRRRWLQFSLRTLLLVMIPIACLSAWISSEYHRGQRQHEAIRWVEEQYFQIEYDHTLTQANWRRRVFGSWFPETAVAIRFGSYTSLPSSPSSPATSQVPPPPPSLPRPTLPGSHVFRSLRPTSIEPLAELTELRILDISGTGVTDLTPLAGLTQLQELILPRPTPVESCAPLAGLTNLRRLDLGQNTGDLSSLRDLQKLEVLISYECDLNTLPPLASLTELHVARCNNNDLQTLTRQPQLRTLHLGYLNDAGIASLAEMPQLEELHLTTIASDDLTPLAELHNLHTLDLFNSLVEDLTPLHGLTNLRLFQLSFAPAKPAGVEALRAALPECKLEIDVLYHEETSWYLEYEFLHAP